MVVIAFILWFANWTLRLLGAAGLADLLFIASLVLIIAVISALSRPSP